MVEDLRLTTEEVAKQLRCKPQTVRRLITLGKLESTKRGVWLTKQSSVTYYLTGKVPKTSNNEVELVEAERLATLAKARAEKAEAENKEGQALQAIAIRKAGMTVEEVQEQGKARRDRALLYERKLDELSEIKDRDKLDFSDEYIAKMNEIIAINNEELVLSGMGGGRDDNNKEEE